MAKQDPKLGFRLLNDFPDTDRDTDPTVGYLLSEGTDFEVMANKTIVNYQNFNLIIFSRENKQREGMQTIINYMTEDLQLDGVVDYTEFQNYQYFPSVEQKKNLEQTQLLFQVRSIL